MQLIIIAIAHGKIFDYVDLFLTQPNSNKNKNGLCTTPTKQLANVENEKNILHLRYHFTI